MNVIRRAALLCCLGFVSPVSLHASLQPASASDLAGATHTIGFDGIDSGTEVNGRRSMASPSK